MNDRNTVTVPKWWVCLRERERERENEFFSASVNVGVLEWDIDRYIETRRERKEAHVLELHNVSTIQMYDMYECKAVERDVQMKSVLFNSMTLSKFSQRM